MWRRFCLNHPSSAGPCGVLLVGAVTRVPGVSVRFQGCSDFVGSFGSLKVLCVTDRKSLSTHLGPGGADGAGNTLHMNCKV